MKKNFFVSLMAVMMLFGMVGFASATILDFEDLIGQATLPTNYAGLNWDSHWQYYDWSQEPFNASSGTTRIFTHNYGGWIDFGQDVTFQGSWVASSNMGQAMWWEGYNDGTKVYESDHLFGGVQTFVDLNWANVDYVKFVSTSYDFFIIDDIKYNEGINVPEPTTLLLLGLGLVGLAGAKRKLHK